MAYDVRSTSRPEGLRFQGLWSFRFMLKGSIQGEGSKAEGLGFGVLDRDLGCCSSGASFLSTFMSTRGCQDGCLD